MEWKYNIEWHNGRISSNKNSNFVNSKSIVIVTSKSRSQREDSLLKIETWVGTNSNNGTNAYARVTRGQNGDPVVAAEVKLEVQIGPNSHLKLAPIRMVDNGHGGKKTQAKHFLKAASQFQLLSMFMFKFTLSFCLLTFPRVEND